MERFLGPAGWLLLLWPDVFGHLCCQAALLSPTGSCQPFPVELLFGQSAPGLHWGSPLQMQYLAFHFFNLMIWFAHSPYCPYPSSSPALWYISCFLQHAVVRKDASCHLDHYWRHLAAPVPGIPWGTPRVTAHQLGFAHCWQIYELSSPASFPPTLSSFYPASISPVGDKENYTRYAVSNTLLKLRFKAFSASTFPHHQCLCTVSSEDVYFSPLFWETIVLHQGFKKCSFEKKSD